MLDITNVLVHKLTLPVTLSPNLNQTRNASEIVKDILHSRLESTLGLHIPRVCFGMGGKFSSEDNTVNLQAASLQAGETGIWAMRLQQKDPKIIRRRWVYHASMRIVSSEHLTLYYAKCCYDHTAGSVLPPREIPLELDQLLDPLFFSNEIRCMCGSFPFPCESQELSYTSLAEFIHLLEDEDRTCPLLLISCPDVLAPEVTADILLGNAVVYWCADEEVFSRFNELVSDNLQTPWDSVRSFLPLGKSESYHPCWMYEDIQRMGVDAFLRGLYQAYCTSMRSEEKRGFLTIEDVYLHRDQAQIATQIEQLESQKAEIKRLSTQLQSLQKQHEESGNQANPTLIGEYESLLGDVMAEVDALKSGISALSTRLYSNMGIGFKPDESESIPLLQELSHAIYSALAYANSRK